MLKRIVTLLTAMILMVNSYTTTSMAADSEYTAGDIIDGILDYELNTTNLSSVDEFIENELAPNAGTTPTEWFVFALARYNGNYDFSGYVESVGGYIKTMESSKATDYQRISLACVAIGIEKDFVSQTVDDQNGKSGIMSYIYGLILRHMAQTGGSNEIELAYELCNMQLEDGGFALAGNISDTDVTAMALQALAPYYADDQVKTVVDEALARLSELQLEDGDYQSYGVPNCESTAQVLVALNTLGIEWKTDTRFIKDGHNIFDGMLKYRLTNGSFSHTYQGKVDEFANAQTLMAAVSCLVPLFEAEAEPYYIVQNEETTEFVETTESTEHSDKSDSGRITGNMIKYGLIMVVVIICLALILVNTVKKKSAINTFLVILAGIVLSTFLYKSDIKTQEEYGESGQEISTDGITVSIAIDSSKAEDRSEDGIILPETEYAVGEGTSVFDLFLEACKDNDIQNEFEGTAGMKNVYVTGIDYLYEFDCGELSGWVYTVNGETPGTGCSNYELEDGDQIKWIYTLDQGRDID